MKRFILFLAAAVMVSTVLAGFKYEGEWGKYGTGQGEFNQPMSVSIAPNGNVYVADYGNQRIQYFTPTGSFLGQWPDVGRSDGHVVSVSPLTGNVYTGGCGDTIRYYTSTGSRLGEWDPPELMGATGGEVGQDGLVYICNWNRNIAEIYIHRPNGSIVRLWRCDHPGRVGVAPNGDVYVAGSDAYLITYYTSTGSKLGSWAVTKPAGVAVASDRRVFVACEGDDLVRYYTPSGSLLGSWGGEGSGPGQFDQPYDVALSADGKRVYVADCNNHRIQYFVDDTAITPTSLGRVKALFK